MTTEQIILVRKSWRLFRNIDPTMIADVFYSKLFDQNPALRRMYPKDMNAQHKKLIDMLNLIIARLDRINELDEEISSMAKRHIGYGVRIQHYDQVGQALIWTLEKGLGTDWRPEVKEAWLSVYTELASIMIKASMN